MDARRVMAGTRGAIGARRVFGKPYERDGVVVIPAARISGGGGGGGGSADAESSGEGFGFGMIGRPVGAYVIRGGKVRWKPAIDVSSMLLRAETIALVGLVAVQL